MSEPLSASLRERTALRYMGDCKCGQCRLVPRVMVDEAADLIDALVEALNRVLGWAEAVAGDNRFIAEAKEEVASVEAATAVLARAKGEPK